MRARPLAGQKHKFPDSGDDTDEQDVVVTTNRVYIPAKAKSPSPPRADSPSSPSKAHTYSFPTSQFEHASNPSLSIEPSLVLELSSSHPPGSPPPVTQRESSLFGKHKEVHKMAEAVEEEPLELDVSRKPELPYQSGDRVDEEDHDATQVLPESFSQSDGVRGGQSFNSGSSVMNKAGIRARDSLQQKGFTKQAPEDSESDNELQPSQEYGTRPARMALSDDERTQPIESNGGAAVLSSGEEDDFPSVRSRARK